MDTDTVCAQQGNDGKPMLCGVNFYLFVLQGRINKLFNFFNNQDKVNFRSNSKNLK